MLHKYSTVAPCDEPKFAPSAEVLNSILNYSKSIEVKRTKKKKTILLNLN